MVANGICSGSGGGFAQNHIGVVRGGVAVPRTTSLGIGEGGGMVARKTLPGAPASPPRTFFKIFFKPYHKHLKPYHKHLCHLHIPPRVLPRQRPYHKHLRHRHALCQGIPEQPASPPHVLPKQEPYHKHLRHCHAFC